MTHARSEQADMNAATILVVDDDPATLLVCRKKLSAEGFGVLQASRQLGSISNCLPNTTAPFTWCSPMSHFLHLDFSYRSKTIPFLG